MNNNGIWTWKRQTFVWSTMKGISFKHKTLHENVDLTKWLRNESGIACWKSSVNIIQEQFLAHVVGGSSKK